MAERLPVTGLGSVMLPTNYEPKRQNQFVLEIEGIDSYLIKSANALPTITFDEKVIEGVKKHAAKKGISYDEDDKEDKEDKMEMKKSIEESESLMKSYIDEKRNPQTALG